MTATDTTATQARRASLPSSPPARAPFGFAVAIVAQIAMMTGASAPSPFYPVLAQQIGFGLLVVSAVFAAYAVALLLALLTAGSLSDHIGRRPVAIGGLLLLAASMVLFWHADSVVLLLLARLLQGAASGVLLSALSAAALDLAPTGRPGIAGLWNALSPGIGLAAGALASGLILDATGEPMLDVFAPLTTIYIVLAVLFFFAPETAPLRSGAWQSLRFRLAIPTPIRGDLWRSAPAILAGWATGGLFLSLGSTIVRTELGGVAHLWQGLAVTLLAGSGALAAFTLRRLKPRATVLFGTAALATGTALSLIALDVTSLPFYLVAAAVTGTGFGTTFSGVVASLAPRIPAAERADTFAVIYVLAYLAFGIPAVAAGLLVGLVGLTAVTVGYGIAVIVFALVALGLRFRRA